MGMLTHDYDKHIQRQKHMPTVLDGATKPTTTINNKQTFQNAQLTA